MVTERVMPVNYDITLYDLELGGAFTFQGTVKIEINVKKEIKEITLNAHQLKVKVAEISPQGVDGILRLSLVCSNGVLTLFSAESIQYYLR